MKLSKIDIRNYKSIVDQTINVENNAIGFIGINESGKTNILNAIKQLNKSYPLTLSDKSKITNLDPVFTYTFLLEKEEPLEIFQAINDHFKKTILGAPLDVIVGLEIKSFTKIVSAEINEDGNYIKKQTSDIVFQYDYTKNIVILKSENEIEPDTTIMIEGNGLSIDDYELFDKRSIPDEFKDSFSPIDEEDIYRHVRSELKNYLNRNIPEVVFWKYDKEHLLPAELDYDDFLTDDSPYDNCVPLYNILMLTEDLNLNNGADVKNIIVKWKVDSSKRRRDSRIITECINKYVKQIWEENDQDLHIELEEKKVTIHVNDPKSTNKNYYDMEARSQGFKTFISFLLTIAAEADAYMISDFILILDEPETHLHPSGVRYMKNKLLELSAQENYVFFATHSIFMIDRKNLKRHIIVSKENEATNFTVVDRNNIIQEEVIYKALGTSIDEFSIPNKNIVFEGDADLLIFEFFIDKCLRKAINTIADYTLLNGGGTRRITQFFNNTFIPIDSDWKVILDNDSPGKVLYSNVLKKMKEEEGKNISTYFYSDIANYELEDILPDSIIK
ncbi:MAG: AAA family ATPase, partial [Candidatus Cloacimonetes bacterium]|nr:AAA family ATPase [Candidatus Cloacimonadota bacterium]